MTQYAYSLDEENYIGPFDTKEYVIIEAASAIEDGDPVWIGEVKWPSEWITSEQIGTAVFEQLQDWMADKIGDIADNFDLTSEQIIDVGQSVLDAIARAGGFRYFTVENVYQVSASELKDK